MPVRLIAAVLIAVVALAGILLLGASRYRGPQPLEAAAPERLSRPAPPGWTDDYVWSTIVRSTTTSLAVAQNRVAFIDDAGALHVLNADTGDPVLVSQTNTVTSSAQPFLASAEGIPVTGIIDGANMLLWRLDAPRPDDPRQVTLGLNAQLYQQGGGLMVSAEQENWVVSADGTLDPISLPDDHVALGVTPEGRLVSAPPQGSWSITASSSGGAHREIRPQANPPGTVGEMHVAWISRGVIAAWGNTDDPAQRTVGLYDALSGELRASATLPTEAVRSGLPLTVSPTAEFAAAGPMLARLRDGSVTVVDRWSTTMSGTRNLYGMRDGTRLTWDGDETVQVADNAVVPWGTSASGYAIVLDPGGGAQVRLGALRPE